MRHKTLHFFSGKGGVGKSSLATAFAYHKVAAKLKTLLVSTDPAHNLSDIVEQPIGNTITKIREHFYALEIDPQASAKQYINQVAHQLSTHTPAHLHELLNQQMAMAKHSPGASEAAMLDEMMTVMLDEQQHFDCIVFDTAPTGHTLRLLSLPEQMGYWMSTLVQQRTKTYDMMCLLNDNHDADPLYDALQIKQKRFLATRQLLQNQAHTHFYYVMNPERLSIAETKSAVAYMQKNNIFVTKIFVNKILPDNLKDAFWQKRKKQERCYLREINNHFTEQSIIPIPLLACDIVTKESITQISHCF